MITLTLSYLNLFTRMMSNVRWSALKAESFLYSGIVILNLENASRNGSGQGGFWKAAVQKILHEKLMSASNARARWESILK